VTRTKLVCSVWSDASSNSSFPSVAGVDGHEMQGEETEELLSEESLESILNENCFHSEWIRKNDMACREKRK
jgi:hypothetical protein